MRIVVIGGVAAGMSAASQARRRDPGCEVVVLDRGHDISYSACGMPYNIGDPARGVDDLVILNAETARSERGIDVRTRHAVQAIEVSRRVVKIADLDAGSDYELSWDALVIASGATAIRPAVPGLDLAGVFVLRDLTDARHIKRYLADVKVSTAVVVGAGYIGIEMADVLHGLGIAVSMLEKADQVLPGFAPAIVEVAAQALERHGVSVQTATSLQSVQREGADLLVHSDRGAVRAQIVIVAVGVRPDVALAREAGIELGASGAIAVDSAMRTSAPMASLPPAIAPKPIIWCWIAQAGFHSAPPPTSRARWPARMRHGQPGRPVATSTSAASSAAPASSASTSKSRAPAWGLQRSLVPDSMRLQPSRPTTPGRALIRATSPSPRWSMPSAAAGACWVPR